MQLRYKSVSCKTLVVILCFIFRLRNFRRLAALQRATMSGTGSGQHAQSCALPHTTADAICALVIIFGPRSLTTQSVYRATEANGLEARPARAGAGCVPSE